MSSYTREVTVGLSLLLCNCFALGQSAAKDQSQLKSTSVTQSHPVVHQGVAITLKVGDFEAARQKAISSVVAHGGKVADAKVTVNGKGRKSGWMRLELPAGELTGTLPEVYGLGKLYGDKMLTSDKTSQYESLARRMEELDKHEARLGKVLNQPKRMRGSDILYLQERLFRTGADQQDLAQWRVDMSRRAGTANVILTMFEPYEIKPVPQLPHTVGEHVSKTFANTWVSFRRFGLRVVGDVAFLVVYAVVWLPITILAWIVGKRLWRKAKPFLFPEDKTVAPPATPA